MKKDGFFSRLDWAAFWAATIITFAVYFFTLGPSVGLEDSGELATAGAHLGVPHPPGYPFWTLCSWIFCKLFAWVTYMGHPTPAWAISCWSAVAGALAAGCTAMLICRSGRDFIGKPSSDFMAFVGGVGGALTFAFSPVEWSQSTIVEIYSLNALFLMWVFLLSYRWLRKPQDKILWLTAFVFGLGLTNYQVLLFAIVPLAIIILMKNLAMFRDVFIYLIPVALTYQILQIGCLMRADANMQADVINKHLPVLKTAATPSSTVIVIAIVALIASIIAGIILKKRNNVEIARKVMMGGGIFSVALMFLATTIFTSEATWGGITSEVAPLIEPKIYAYIGTAIIASVVCAMMGIFSGNDDEPIWKGVGLKFLAASTGFAILAILIAANQPMAGNGGYQGEVYPWAKSTLIFMALVILLGVLAFFTKKGLAFAVPAIGLHVAAFILLKSGAMNGLTHPCSWWFCWPIAWNFVLLAMTWAALPNGRSVAGAAFFAQLGVSFYVYMPIVSDLRNPPMNWGYPRTWEGFKHAIMRGQYEAIGIQPFEWSMVTHYFKDVMMQFTDILVAFALVPFIFVKKIVAKSERKTFCQWMIAAASCFLMMSVLLIMLAQVKGDVQDGFIQKVKFISSHAMIAMWIGYGLAFALALTVGKISNKQLRYILSALVIVACGLTPIIQNYTNDRLVFEMGGSEQNGHTFGWQFGAYQLEGANAIKEQLIADEEPLPDPNWPLPMEKSAIFFGGTDPGRFVPTYMIYSADFRPDVYLITQNALADDTYMSVERDLYGDEIWIPSKEDSADAFNIYVDEVQRGIRQANGDLQIQNGRVQVTGALGVMEINGILTKMMFDHDRLNHAFYVEESYVIPWMYPYLSPHGLIMKINKDVTPYNVATATKDRDFWDWYTRRLLKDKMYRRDFAGQKSFSKLRAAIAGLYTKQGRHSDAAQAYREACLLYPASPEATFRYAQDMLLPYRKWDIALELMDYTDSIDPNNMRTHSLRGYIVSIREIMGEIERLSPKLEDGTITRDEMFKLASCCYQIGRVGEAARILRPLIGTIADAETLRSTAEIFVAIHDDATAEILITKYLKLKPNESYDMWLELAKIQYRAGKAKESQQCFISAYKIDANAVYSKLQRDEELQTLAAPLFKRSN